MADKDWLPDAAAIRASGLAFIPMARRFAQRVGILDADLRGDPDTTAGPARGASVVVDQAGYTAYVRAWSDLVGLTGVVEWGHYALMRKRVRARTESALTPPAPPERDGGTVPA